MSERKSLLDARDPFADDVLGRLIESNQGYQRSHGHYIVPLAERLLETRRKLRDVATAARAVRDRIGPIRDEWEHTDELEALEEALAALESERG